MDINLGAGLVVCLAHIDGAVDALEMGGGARGINVDKYIKRNEKEGIDKATQFFGKGMKNYGAKLEKILQKWYQSNKDTTELDD